MHPSYESIVWFRVRLTHSLENSVRANFDHGTNEASFKNNGNLLSDCTIVLSQRKLSQISKIILYFWVRRFDLDEDTYHACDWPGAIHTTTVFQFSIVYYFIVVKGFNCNFKQRKWQKDQFVVRRKILLNGQVFSPLQKNLWRIVDSGYDMDFSILGRKWNGFWTQENAAWWNGDDQNWSFRKDWWVLALKNFCWHCFGEKIVDCT